MRVQVPPSPLATKCVAKKLCSALVAQWIEHWPSKPMVGGSNSSQGTCSSRRSVAQLAEHSSPKRKVRGSNPFRPAHYTRHRKIPMSFFWRKVTTRFPRKQDHKNFQDVSIQFL